MGRLRLASELTGQGRPLVLIPGTFSTRRVWLRQLGALTPTFGCLLFDQPAPATAWTPAAASRPTTSLTPSSS